MPLKNKKIINKILLIVLITIIVFALLVNIYAGESHTRRIVCAPTGTFMVVSNIDRTDVGANEGIDTSADSVTDIRYFKAIDVYFEYEDEESIYGGPISIDLNMSFLKETKNRKIINILPGGVVNTSVNDAIFFICKEVKESEMMKSLSRPRYLLFTVIEEDTSSVYSNSEFVFGRANAYQGTMKAKGRFFTQERPAILRGDVLLDGKISIRDVTQIQRFIAGFDGDSFPYNEKVLLTATGRKTIDVMSVTALQMLLAEFEDHHDLNDYKDFNSSDDLYQKLV